MTLFDEKNSRGSHVLQQLVTISTNRAHVDAKSPKQEDPRRSGRFGSQSRPD